MINVFSIREEHSMNYNELYSSTNMGENTLTADLKRN